MVASRVGVARVSVSVHMVFGVSCCKVCAGSWDEREGVKCKNRATNRGKAKVGKRGTPGPCAFQRDITWIAGCNSV